MTTSSSTHHQARPRTQQQSGDGEATAGTADSGSNGHRAAGKLAIPYTAASGERRQALIGVDERGVYYVYDTPATSTGHVIGCLGADEGFPQAVALIADYLQRQIDHATGTQLEDPLQKVDTQPLSKIAANWRRATVTPVAEEKEREALTRFYHLAAEIARHHAALENGSAAHTRKETP